MSIGCAISGGGLSFGAPEPLVVGPALVSQITVVDITADGDLDLVVASSLVPYRGIWAFENTGVFPFDTGAAVNIGAQVPTILDVGPFAALDADGDGDQDLVTTPRNGSGVVQYVENLGAGTYAASAPFFSVSATPVSVQVADADGDGTLDVAIQPSSAGGSEVALVRGDGAGGFLAPQWIVAAPVPVRDLRFRDVAPGGGAELLSIDANAGVHLRTWEGTEFGPSRELQYRLRDIGAADFANLGRADLVGYSFLTQEIIRVRRSAGGELGPPEVVAGPLVPGASRPIAFDIGDVDADGRDDLVFLWDDTTSQGPRVAVRRGLANGELGAPANVLDGLVLGTNNVTLADLGSDGSPDLVTSSAVGAGQIVTARNQGDGTFVSDGWLGGAAQSNIGVPRIVNADGGSDLDVVLHYPSSLQWFQNLGGGTFTPRTLFFPAGLEAEITAIGDMDGDGLPDIVSVRNFGSGPTLGWAKATGFLQFAPFTVLVPFANYEHIQFVDLDRDGLDDLIAVRGGDALVVRKRTDPMTLGAELEIDLASAGALSLIRALKAVDIDGDGDLDLALGTQLAGSFGTSWLVAENLTHSDIGDPYCMSAQPNSTGQLGELGAYGSRRPALSTLQLRASALPPASTGYFLASRAQGLVTSVPNSVGTLCLGGSIGRFVGAGQVGTTDAGGTLALDVDLTRMPTPNLGLVAALPGQTWHFQAWHRDSASGQATSNFTSGLGVTFL